ncbi:hypothetical protein [Umezawaea beigongshangensis]|nr:hypothetical protein [Umezawaea beigongshangensis]
MDMTPRPAQDGVGETRSAAERREREELIRALSLDGRTRYAALLDRLSR